MTAADGAEAGTGTASSGRSAGQPTGSSADPPPSESAGQRAAFCVECGAEGVPLRDGVCRDCYLGDRALLVRDRPEVQIEVCKSCGAERRGDSWRTRDDATEAFDRAVLDVVRVHEAVEDPEFTLGFEQTAPRTLDYTVVVEGTMWGEPVEDLVEVRVRSSVGMCTTCSRQAGGYYEAVLQLRPPKGRGRGRRDVRAELDEAYREVVDHLAQMREGGNRQAFVSREEEVHGGVDLYVGDFRAARQAAKHLAGRFGATVGESHEQVGMKDGQPLTRAAISVRLPAYAVGDFVAWDDALWRVDGFTRGLIALTRVPDGRTTHVDPDDKTLRQALHADEVERAVVVSSGGGEAQVLDPETMETVTVRVPPDLVVGDRLDVVRWEGRLRVVPP